MAKITLTLPDGIKISAAPGQNLFELSRGASGLVTLDPGYGNTAECRSQITYVDGERGILRYRGISIEQLAEKSTFLETTWLLIYGELPTQKELKGWSALFTEHEMLHEGLHHHFDGFPATGHCPCL